MGNYKIEKTPATDMMLTNLLTNTSPNLPPRVILTSNQSQNIITYAYGSSWLNNAFTQGIWCSYLCANRS
jgi:hypothetical protein